MRTLDLQLALRSLLLGTSLLSVPLVSACGGAQHTEIDVEATTTTRVTVGPEGEWVLDDDHPRLARRGWFRLVPAHWPNAAGPAPVVGVGRVVRHGEQNLAVLFGSRQLESVEAQWVDVTRSVPSLDGSKMLAEVASVDGTEIVLDRGGDQGVRSGDRYLILGRDPDEPERVGSYVSGVARIVDVAEASSVAMVMHASTPVRRGDLVRFAHVEPDVELGAVTIAVADMGVPDVDGLPALIAPIPEIIADYGLTNIGVVPIDQTVDPRPADAAETATALAPETGYGVMAFGEVTDGGLVYNVTAFGDAPYPVTTISVLEGGLAIDGDVDALAAPISHALLAAALTLQGESALAAFVAEEGTRQAPPAGLRYHLREQLAVAYDAMGMTDEAMTTMRLDLAQAEADGAVLPLLNALSVRGGLAEDAGDRDLALADAERYLALSEGVQSESARFYPQIRLARLLDRSGASEEALRLYEAMMQRGGATAVERYVLAIDMALYYFGNGDYVASLILVADAERSLNDAINARLMREADAASFHALMASLYGALTLRGQAGDDVPQSIRDLREEAQGHYQQALDALDTIPVDSRAHVASLLADLEAGFGHTETAFDLSWLAASNELRSAQYEDAINRMADLSMTLLELAPNDATGFDMYLEALQTAQVAAEVALRIGRDADAALLMMYVGTIYWRLGESDSAVATLADAIALARPTAHYTLIANLCDMQAEMAEQMGEDDDVATLREACEMWEESATLDAAMEADGR